MRATNVDVRLLAERVDRLIPGSRLHHFHADRARRRNISRVALRGALFGRAQKHRSWVAHRGGVGELQYNIGHAPIWMDAQLRMGLALSLTPTRVFKDIASMQERYRLLRSVLNSMPYLGEHLWHWVQRPGGQDITAMPALEEMSYELQEHDFYFIGAGASSSVKPGDVLSLFEMLLPLYDIVEDAMAGFVEVLPSVRAAPLRDGHVHRDESATARRGVGSARVDLKHNALQNALVRQLRRKHPGAVIQSEYQTVTGGFVDVAMEHRGCRTFFEVKVGDRAFNLVRQAIGQLLEYGYWPGALQPDEIVVAGDAKCDEITTQYIDRLRADFGLPIRYVLIER